VPSHLVPTIHPFTLLPLRHAQQKALPGKIYSLRRHSRGEGAGNIIKKKKNLHPTGPERGRQLAAGHRAVDHAAGTLSLTVRCINLQPFLQDWWRLERPSSNIFAQAWLSGISAKKCQCEKGGRESDLKHQPRKGFFSFA